MSHTLVVNVESAPLPEALPAAPVVVARWAWGARWLERSWRECSFAVVLLTVVGCLCWYGSWLAPAPLVFVGGAVLGAALFFWRRTWSDCVGPLFSFELVQAARRERVFRHRSLLAIIFLEIVGGVYLFWVRDSFDPRLPEGPQLAELGASLTFLVLLIQFPIVAFLSPFFSYHAVVEEKEKNRLEFLLAADLSNRDIVLSKLAARLATIFFFLLTGFPILCVIQLFGGFNPEMVLAGYAVTALIALSGACRGILYSVQARNYQDANTRAFWIEGTLAIFYFVLLEAPRLLSGASVTAFLTTCGLDPEAVYDAAVGLNHLIGAGNAFQALVMWKDLVLADVLPVLAIHGSMALFCTAWAVLRFRKIALKQAEHAGATQAATTDSAVPRPLPPVGDRPILWWALHRREARPGWLGWTIALGFLAAIYVPSLVFVVRYFFGDAIAREDLSGAMNLWVRWVGTFLAWTTILFIAAKAALSISKERENQTLDSLLTTPMSAGAVVFEKWAGCVLPVARFTFILLLGPIWMLGVVTGGLHPLAVVLLALSWLAFAVCAANLGLYYSLICESSKKANSKNINMLTALMVGHWLLWTVYLGASILTGGAGISLCTRLFHIHLGLTPPVFSFLFAFQGNGTNAWDAIAWENAGISLMGVFFWAAGGLILWKVNVARLRREREGGKLPTGREARSETGWQPVPRSFALRRLGIGLAAALLLALLAGVGWRAYRARDDECLRQALAELDRADPGWRLDALEARRAHVANKDNAALTVQAVARSIPSSWSGWRPSAGGERHGIPQKTLLEILADLGPETPLENWQAAELRAHLAQVSQARQEARKLASLSQGRFPIDWSLNRQKSLPHHKDVYSVTRLLELDAVLLAHYGAADQAMTSGQALLNAGRALGDEPTLHAQEWRAYCQRRAVQSMERTLAHGQVSAVNLAAAQVLLEDEIAQPVFSVGVRGERARLHEVMEVVEAGTAKLSNLGEANDRTQASLMDLCAASNCKVPRVELLQVMTRLLEASQLPVAEQESALKQLDEAQKKLSRISFWILPNCDWSGAFFRRGQVMMRCAVVALAAERYRLVHGNWPDSLDELVPEQLSALPADPLGGSLCYRKLADGAVVYSIGPDRADNSGALDRKFTGNQGTDWGFRLWNADKRRRAAIPAQPAEPTK